jgi:hypothetical protein
MSYLTEPTKYNAVHAPQPAKEEDLDWEEGIYAYQSAIFSMGNQEKQLPEDHDYRSGENCPKSFLPMKGHAPSWRNTITIKTQP